ncbi:MAG TPA: pilus assembly protein TadG-related protein [Acidimicrobiales bacterium]|nr:pilus assembly protein TadG-related protein [Acidimicrobiales bacterium]
MSLGFRASVRGNVGSGNAADLPDGGVVIVYFALALLVIMGMAAFVIDLGYWYFQASRIQRAADAAALAGVTYMPGDLSDATTAATTVAAKNGFSSAAQDVVTVSAVPGAPDQLAVSIEDPNVPTFFSRVFGLNSIRETRVATAQYDPPIPLGSPENSLGTGDLSCSGPGATCENEANFWLAISGYCTAREDGDEYMSAYDGNHQPAGTVCPVNAIAPSTTFANVDYNPTGYVYDIDDPPTPGGLTTANDVTLEIYDPAYNPPPNGTCNGAAGSNAGDSSLEACGVATSITTNWLLYAPSPGPFNPSGTVLAPAGGASRSNPGVFRTGDPTCENHWCSLYTIPAGSPAGNYRLNLWTSTNEPNSAGTNQFSLRAMIGDGPTPCALTCTTASVDNSNSFVPCSTIAENGNPANPQCPEIEGDTSMSIYVNAPGSAQCTTPIPRQEQASVGGPIIDVTAPEPCATFYLAQVNPDYAGKTMTVTLFDPGEGATAIEIIQPDGQLAQFTYQTVDTPAEDGPNSGAQYISNDGNDPPSHLVSCICNPGLKPGALSGRVSPSEYNDRYLQIEATLPAGSVLAQNGGWYRVVYVFNGASVSDRTTWDVSIGGDPIHLVQ